MTTARQAAAQRQKLLDQHARLMARERKIREAYGPLALRWGREFSGLIAFALLRSQVDTDLEEQLDGLIGPDQWAIDKGRWRNCIEIIVPKANSRHPLTRMLAGNFKPVRLTNEVAHLARRRRGGHVGYPHFPWETDEDGMANWVAYEHFRQTDPRTKVVAKL